MNWFIIIYFILMRVILSGVPAQRIVGGNYVEPFSFNFMIVITYLSKQQCGGTLIEKNVVLTSAHCFKKGQLKDYQMMAHRHNLNLTNANENGVELKMKKLKFHPSWDPETYDSDIVLILVKPKYRSQLNYKPTVRLDSDNLGWKSDHLVFSLGWGDHSYDVLQKVYLPIVDPASCKRAYQAVDEFIDIRYELCAGDGTGKRDTCHGDSGGPLLTTQDNHYVLVGMVSWGMRCADPNFPGVYLRIHPLIPWITKTVKMLQSSHLAN